MQNCGFFSIHAATQFQLFYKVDSHTTKTITLLVFRMHYFGKKKMKAKAYNFHKKYDVILSIFKVVQNR